MKIRYRRYRLISCYEQIEEVHTTWLQESVKNDNLIIDEEKLNICMLMKILFFKIERVQGFALYTRESA